MPKGTKGRYNPKIAAFGMYVAKLSNPDVFHQQMIRLGVKKIPTGNKYDFLLFFLFLKKKVSDELFFFPKFYATLHEPANASEGMSIARTFNATAA